MKTPSLLPGKSKPIFPLRFAPGRPCFTIAESRPARAPLRFKTANTFLCAPPHFIPYYRKEKKMQSGMIIYLLKYYHKVSHRSETLATAQGLAHAKDYAIKPLRYLLRFLLRSFSPYGWFPFKV